MAMTSLKGVPVENINIGTVKLKRFPNGHVFWYYMEVQGVNVRIDRTLYKTIKKLLTNLPSKSTMKTNQGSNLPGKEQ
jgi:hypothetical protein